MSDVSPDTRSELISVYMVYNNVSRLRSFVKVLTPTLVYIKIISVILQIDIIIFSLNIVM